MILPDNKEKSDRPEQERIPMEFCRGKVLMEFYGDKVKNGFFSLVYEKNVFLDFEFHLELQDRLLRSSRAILAEECCLNVNDEFGNGKLTKYVFLWPSEDIKAYFHITQYKNSSFATVYTEVVNTGDRPVVMNAVKPLVLGEKDVVLGKGINDWVILRNAMMSYDQIGIHHFGNPAHDVSDVATSGGEDAASNFLSDDTDVINIGSNYISALRSISGEGSVFLGFYTMSRQFGVFNFKCSRDEKRFISYEACCMLDGIELMPGRSISSEKLLIDFSDSFCAIRRYSDAAARACGAVQKRPVPTGWCSWYFFYESVSEKDVLNNVEFIGENNLPVEYVQVDMGWEQRLGDWHAGYKFPHGMKWLADRIHSSGLKAGLWLSPFWVEPRSEVHRDHPEWLLKDREGNLLTFTCHIKGYIIDVTIPEAREWVAGVIRRVVEEWGFDYIKVDFLRAVALFPEVKYSGNVTRAEALRIGMEAVREGAGTDAFILACGGQYGPTLGIADANRTSNDIGADWSLLKVAFKQNLLKYWMHGKWWINDPDCLLLRGPLEGIPGSVAGYGRIMPGNFSEIEVNTMLTLIRMTGGMVFLGDNLPELDRKKIDTAAAVLRPEGKAALPRDMFESPIPHILDLELENKQHEVVVVNWTDRPLEEKLRLDELIGFAEPDIWYNIVEKRIGTDLGAFNTNGLIDTGIIEPHGCLHLVVSPDAGAD